MGSVIVLMDEARVFLAGWGLGEGIAGWMSVRGLEMERREIVCGGLDWFGREG